MKSFALKTLGVAVLLIGALSCSQNNTNLKEVFVSSLRFSQAQLKKAVAEVNDPAQYPRSTLENGKWGTTSSTDWTAGFFPGCLWYMYDWTSDSSWQELAEKWTNGLEKEKYNTNTHDVGFMIFSSFGNGYRLTRNPHYKDVILQAAQTLANRYNQKVGCIKSWDFMGDDKYPVIIDNMMNLELLFWASKNGGKKEWYDIAISHAEKTMKNHIRDDAGSYHVVLYDTLTGNVKERITFQGYADESTWARGQAWGIYGFTMAFRESGDERFLKTAHRLAAFFIRHLPEDYIPYWDFNAPEIPNEERDTSAGAVAASALLELMKFTREPELKEQYYKTARTILANLSKPPYLARGAESSAILLQAVGAKTRNKEIDVSLIYGDYYYLEALLKFQNMKRKN